MLDTCVLLPSLQRDFLLSLAVENLYRPLWNDAILAELELHEERELIRRGTDPATAHRRAAGLVAVMTNAFDDALVRGWESLEAYPTRVTSMSSQQRSSAARGPWSPRTFVTSPYP